MTLAFLLGCSASTWCERLNLDCDEPAAPVAARPVDEDGDVWASVATGGLDCDDSDPTIYPDATELCDGLDNNCNGEVDEGLGDLGYRDADSDGYGDAAQTRWLCEFVSGYVLNDTDCDDTDPRTYPGAAERCDNKDNSCNGVIDDGVVITIHADADADRYGDPAIEQRHCIDDLLPPGYVPNDTDCDDQDPTVSPGVDEICSDGVDNNCDTLVDEAACLQPGRFLFGGGAGTLAGLSVDVGDIDGDGRQDWAIGANVTSLEPEDGAVFVHYGGLSENQYVDDAADRIVGSSAGMLAGRSVQILGDVNEDGYDDLIVGVPGRLVDADPVGGAYLFLGPISGASPLSIADGRTRDADGVFSLAHTAFALDDLTGDGIPDFALSASDAYFNTDLWIYSGEEQADIPALGRAVGWHKRSSASVQADSGDLNGDGLPDLLLGDTRFAKGRGRVVAFFGPVTADVDMNSPDASRIGRWHDTQVGHTLHCPGDVDGDGHDDLLIGAPESGSGGVVFVEYGPISGEGSLLTADATLVGQDGSDQVGIAVSGGGDMSGDGRAEVLVAGVRQSGAFGPEALVYALSQPGLGLVEMRVDSRWVFSAAVDLSDAQLDIFPMTLTGGVDFSGDGVPDVALGIPEYAAGDEDGGAVRFFETY